MPRATAPLTAFLRLGPVDRDDGDAAVDLGQDRVRHRQDAHLGWKRMPPSKRMISAFM